MATPWTVLPLLACALVAAGAAWLTRAARARARALAAQAEAATASVAELRRVIRLAAADLRGPALALLAQAETLPEAGRPPLRATARALLELAESLFDGTEAPDMPRRLREEKVPLAPVVDFVVAQVTAQLGATRRTWRVDGDIAAHAIFADRRALHQSLIRVVTAAALATGDGDWIDIRLERSAEAARLVVEDEGAGLALAEPAGGGTRGLGMGLALVRQLMAAHGGALLLESAARVGTRAVLAFPAARLLEQ